MACLYLEKALPCFHSLPQYPFPPLLHLSFCLFISLSLTLSLSVSVSLTHTHIETHTYTTQKKLKKANSEVTEGNLKFFPGINLSFIHHCPSKYKLQVVVFLSDSAP